MIAQGLLQSKENVVTRRRAEDWADMLFQGSELTDVSLHPWDGGLVPLMSGSEDLRGTLVLALRGVTAFRYGSDSIFRKTHAMVVDRVFATSGTMGLRIDLFFYGNADALSVMCAEDVLFSVDMAGQELLPLDYGESPATQVFTNQPSWQRSVIVREVVGLR